MRKYLIFLFVLPVLITNCAGNKTPSKTDLVLGLQKMSDLATAEYVVTKLIKANDDKTWYKAGDRKILMSCKASLVAGIDFSKITENDINVDGKNISITIPHAKLIYVDIKPEDVKTVYQEVSLFRNNFSSEEKNNLAKQAERQITASADSLGILVTAESNASIFINNFLRKQGFENISISSGSPKQTLQ
ncbi:MAG: DUF4230 domain-containing protein [Ginsengibacter sp.]